MMNEQNYKTSYIGETAWQILSENPTGQVLGMTSQGIFILFLANKVVFLSYEADKGPLTLNLDANITRLDRMSLGDRVRVISGDLYFDSIETRILTGEAALWQTPEPVGAVQPGQGIHKQLVSITRILLAQNRIGEISSLLPNILNLSSEFTGIQAVKFPLQQIQGLLQAIESRSSALIVARLESLLGYGTGLTPSGDDLVTGFLLTLNRWGKNLLPGIELQEFNRSVVQTARQKTTALSANLIECAANGDANERLIQAFDGIMTGVPGPEKCARLLLSWGNSSGGDALTGMVLAISLFDSTQGRRHPLST